MVAGKSPWRVKLVRTVWTRDGGCTLFFEFPPEAYGDEPDVVWTLVTDEAEGEPNA